MLLFLFLILSVFGYSEMKMLSPSPRVYIIDDFLSDRECSYLMELARPQLKRSTVVDDKGKSDGIVDYRRTSQGMFLMQGATDPVVKGIEKRIADVTQIPVENGEAIQVLRYQEGEEYRPHFDFFDPRLPGSGEILKRGGQRVATVIMYLHSPEQGGDTIFPNAKINVTPTKGRALLFYNCLPSGETDPMSFHGGAPVLKGEKWIATKWLRERTFK